MKKLISLILVLVLGLLVVGYGAAANDNAATTLNFSLAECISITITSGANVSFGTNLDPNVGVTIDDATFMAIESNIVDGWTITGSMEVLTMPTGAVAAAVKDALDWGFFSYPGQVHAGSGSEIVSVGYELIPTMDMPPGNYVMTVTFTVVKD